MTRSINKPPTDIAGYNPTRDAGDCKWDGKAAARAVDFFPECLQFVEGQWAGQPFALQKWQKDYVATLFGWKRPDGTRRYRESLAALPRKNAKTTTVAGLGLYMLCCDGEQGAQVYSAAFSRDQASLIYAPASKMAKRSKHLATRVDCIESTKRIVFKQTGSFLRAIPAEAANSHGFNASAVLFDELHTQRTRELYDVLKTSQGARRQPLFLSISTAGYDRNGVCYEVWKYARAVRDGMVRDPQFLPMIYEINEGEAWDDEATWKRVNPNLGVSISTDFLRAEFGRAKQLPAYENTFRNLYLNQWTEQAIRWLPMELWDACNVTLPELSGEPCWCGLDLSTTRDITAFAMVFRFGDAYAVLPHFWIPQDTASQKEREDLVPYRQWAQQGYVTLTEGNTVDHARVRADINRFNERYNIQEIAIDRWNAAQITTELAGDGLVVTQFGQGFASMSAPSKELERLVLAGTLIHGGNPVLRWMATNAARATDAAGNIKPAKDKSTGRIDGIVATVMGLARAMTAAYTTTGELFLV